MCEKNSISYEAGLQENQKNVNADAAKENVLDFYRRNESTCIRAYEIYQKYETEKQKYLSEPTSLNLQAFRECVGKKAILLLTANPIEEGILIHYLYEHFNQNMQLQNYQINGRYYHLVVKNDYTLVHLHAGRTGDEYTRKAVNAATKLFTPYYIFALGICYGLNYEDYSIGSVFISNEVQTFRLNFRDIEDSAETLYQAEIEYNEKPDIILSQTLFGFFSYYQLRDLLNINEVKISVGKFLSTNSLVSSKRVKDAVMRALGNNRPAPLGGEMEGGGILKSAIVEEEHFNHWLLIKSISDWGEKKNSLDRDRSKNDLIKNSIQSFAMVNTCNAFHAIISHGLI